jgi:hypothetical protein
MRTVVSIATKGDRPEQLEKTIDSLIKQCTDMYIYYNNDDENIDYTDLSKFWFLSEQKEPCYYFSCDDDIIYPPDYIEHTKNLIDKYGTIITYHGRRLTGDLNKYYKGRHTVYDFRGAQDLDVFVDVGGTGVMGFRTDLFNPVGIHLQPYKCMSDLVLSRWAKNENQKIVCAKRKQNWLIQQEVKGGISQTYATNDSEQVKLMNQILE